MKNLRLTSLVLCAIVLAGCGTVIFRANFDSGSGSPQGPPPGKPDDDQITVHKPENPVLLLGKLLFFPDIGGALFFSHPVQDPERRKTIFWIGQLASGEGPINFDVSAEDAPGTPGSVNTLTVRVAKDEVTVFAPYDTLLHSAPLVPHGQHEIFISLRLKAGSETYRITITQPGAEEMLFTGPLHPLTVDWIKLHARIFVRAEFVGPLKGLYLLDEMIMREYK